MVSPPRSAAGVVALRKWILGLTLAPTVPVFYTSWIGPSFVEPLLGQPGSVMAGFGVIWAFALAIVLVTLSVEQRPSTSIGWRRPSLRSALIAVGLGVALSLLVPVLTLAVNAVLPPSGSGTITQVATAFPWWVLLLGVVTAGVTEEILFRGYAFERLRDVTRSAWSGDGETREGCKQCQRCGECECGLPRGPRVPCLLALPHAPPMGGCRCPWAAAVRWRWALRRRTGAGGGSWVRRPSGRRPWRG